MRTAVVRSAAGQTRPEPASARQPSPAHPLLDLQRSAGNQAMQRAIAGGSPLPGELRSSLESYFRTPLDRVRLHSGEASQSLADSLGARAFTVGQDIHLGREGARAIGSERNQLIAHEVVHTVQQGEAGGHANLQVGAPDDHLEQQAERMAGAFVRGGAAETVQHGGAPVIQRAMHRVHYGVWEDLFYQLLPPNGVEMRLRFHPNEKALANVIGLTQAVKTTQNSRIETSGVLGQRQATAGAGTGYAIDQFKDHPNPLYATTDTLRPGGDPARFEDYGTIPVTGSPQTQDGSHYAGHGKHGFGKMVNDAFAGDFAELYDAPRADASQQDSSQVFETAALGIDGTAGTAGTAYFGSVGWGWETDARGRMKKRPFEILSQGTPTANFLTAASLWNPTRAGLVYDTTGVVRMLDDQGNPFGSPIPAGARVASTESATANGGAYIKVARGSDVGYVDAKFLTPVAEGAETVDLPVPLTYTVSNPAGTTLAGGASPVRLPKGTRVAAGRKVHPAMTFHVEATVVDGPFTGQTGFVLVPDLERQTLGTR